MTRKKKRAKGKKEVQKEIEETETTETLNDVMYDTPELNALIPSDIGESDFPEKRELEWDIKNIKVILPYHVWQKVMIYTKMLDVEINGLGEVERDGNIFTITDVFLLEQVVSKGQCEIVRSSHGDMLERYLREGKDPSKIKLWWHSHHTMGTNWSSTDETTGEQFKGRDFLISIVTTHKGDMRCRINIYEPIEYCLDNVKLTIPMPEPSPELILQCEEEIKEMVKERTFIHTGAPKGQIIGFNQSQGNQGNEMPRILDKSTEPLPKGPMGPCIVTGRIKWIWNHLDELYIPYDAITGQVFQPEEVYEMIGWDEDPNYLSGLGYYYGTAV